MQIVSASAVEMFCDALATRSPNATPTGRRLSTGGLPTCPWPAATIPVATTQRKAGRREAAGTTAPPEVRQCQQPGAIRHPRAPAASSPVRLFDPRRRNPYSQRMRPLAPDSAASPPVRHADVSRATASAIRDEPTVGNQTTDLPGTRATHAQVGHFDPARRNPYAQRTGSARGDTCTQSLARLSPGETAAVSSRPPEQSGEAKEGQGLCPLDPTKGSGPWNPSLGSEMGGESVAATVAPAIAGATVAATDPLPSPI
jgi:hypothetical protein